MPLLPLPSHFNHIFSPIVPNIMSTIQPGDESDVDRTKHENLVDDVDPPEAANVI